MYLAQGHNAVPPVRLEPATLKHSTNEPPRAGVLSLYILITVSSYICLGVLKKRLPATFLLRAQNLCLIKKNADNNYFWGLQSTSL